MLAAWAGLLALGFVSGVVVQLVVRFTADHRRLAAARRGMYAAVLELRLFNDNPTAMWRAQRDLISHNVQYARGLLWPSALTVFLVAAAMLLVGANFSTTGLAPDRAAILSVHLAQPPSGGAPSATLDAPAEVGVETGAVWFPSAQDVAWRLRPRTWGEFVIHLRVEGQALTEAVSVTEGIRQRSDKRRVSGRGAVESISLTYPARSFRLFGYALSWLAVYAIATLGFAILFRRLGAPAP